MCVCVEYITESGKYRKTCLSRLRDGFFHRCGKSKHFSLGEEVDSGYRIYVGNIFFHQFTFRLQPKEEGSKRQNLIDFWYEKEMSHKTKKTNASTHKGM